MEIAMGKQVAILLHLPCLYSEKLARGRAGVNGWCGVGVGVGVIKTMLDFPCFLLPPKRV